MLLARIRQIILLFRRRVDRLFPLPSRERSPSPHSSPVTRGKDQDSPSLEKRGQGRFPHSGFTSPKNPP
jgi:hypothetical protein